MKRIFSYFAWASLLLLSGKTMAEDYLMPKFAYEEKTISSGETITFYDFMGEDDIPSSTSSNSYAVVVFRPAEAGYAVKVHFEYIEMKDDINGYISYFDIFNGVFDKNLVNNGTSWPTSISSATSPAQFQTLAEPLQHYENCNVTDVDFLSTDISGALSFCFHYRWAAKIRGWKAVVSTEKMEDMTILGATADYSFINTEIWGGKSAVALAGLSVVTTGSANPYALTSVRFTLNGADVIDASSLTLYEGQAANAVSLKKIDAVFSHVGENYEVTLNRPLTVGENKFTIAADIAPSAPFEATISVNISSVETTDETFTTFTPATPVELRVAAMYLMTKDATYSIGQEVSFYDDGGKDGNISENFEGKVVFRPANNNEKVKLVFNNIHIFYSDYAASLSGLVDWLYVYNGNSTANEDLLFQALQSDYTTDVVIKSTADNGSLTVVHRSCSASTNLKSGWEATVSTFTPQPMRIQSVENTKQTGSTVSAGSSNLQIAGIKITTEETEPALVVQSLGFNTANTFPQISTAKLYYTKDNTFSTNTLIGTASVETDKVTITAESEIRLREGENYLWIAYDLSPLAANDRKVDIALEKLTFSNSVEYTAFQPIEGCMTIENIAVQDCGEQTITVQGEWQYTHTVASEYSSRYKADDCEQTIVFRPAGSGNMIQIDYTDFDVYYSSSAYSVRATYIVYSGVGTTGEKLWELDANGKKPEHIRSTAADGTVTIVFNANTLYSSYTGDGWHATVREYTPQQMQIDNIIVEQASDKLVKPGEQQAAILDLNLQTTGTLSPLTLNSLTLDLKGSEQNISRVYLLQDAAVLAWADPAAQVTLTIDEPKELNEYSNRFTVAFDLKQDATVGQTVDAALMQITTNLSSITVSDGDPEGERQIKNVLLLQSGDNGTVVIGEQSLVLYDDGGPDGPYTKNFDGYVTFRPSSPDCAIELVVESYQLANYAPVNIYYGSSHEGEPDAVVEYNYSDPEKYVGSRFVSTADDGSLTVWFRDRSYGTQGSDGWEFEIRQHRLTDLEVTAVEAVSVAPALQTVGAKGLTMLRIALTVEGDRTPLEVESFVLDTNAFVSAVTLYQTGLVPSFSTDVPFAAPYTISARGTYYFWVVADASSTANEGDALSVSLRSVSVGGRALQPSSSETAVTRLAHGMRGNYYIGPSFTDDFGSVSEALAALEVLGVESHVVFRIAAGYYTETPVLSPVKGTSESATVTFCSATGDAADVVFSSADVSDTKGVWTVDGADWIILRNLTFRSDLSSVASSVLVFKNQSHHALVDGCVVLSSATANMHLIRVISEDVANSKCDFFTLRNSRLTGGYVGLNIAQGGYATHPFRRDYEVSGNTFSGQQKQMVYASNLEGLSLTGNTFTATGLSVSDFRAIDVRIMGGDYIISGNRFLLSSSSYVTGIYFAVSGETNCREGASVWVDNNALSLFSSAASASAGIRLKWMRGVRVAHNTVRLESPYVSSSALWLENTKNLSLEAVNNIFHNASAGYAVWGEGGLWKHNCLYAASGAVCNAHSDFAEWLSSLADGSAGNLSEEAHFASSSLLLLREAGGLVSGLPLSDLTVDLAGRTRADVPTIGAYEYDPALFRLPALAEGYPLVRNVSDTRADVVLRADGLGTARIWVRPAEAQEPSVSDLLTYGAELTLSDADEAVFTAEGLTEETAYRAWVLLCSPLGEPAPALVSSEPFTTRWTLRPVALRPLQPLTRSLGDPVSLTALLEDEYEQAQPYSFLWYTAFGDTLSREAVLQTVAERTAEYIVQVTDAFGQTATASAVLTVLRPHAEADFEEYRLADGAAFVSSPAWADQTPSWLFSGTYAFANTPNRAWGAFTGFTVSSDPSSVCTGSYYLDQFRAAAGGAAEGDNFAVAYYSEPYTGFAGHRDTVRLVGLDGPQRLTGFYVTNTVYTLDAVLNGDYSTPPFGRSAASDEPSPDVLTLTVHGLCNGTPTGTVEFCLADYRDADPDEHYALSTWEWLDLSDLGEVTSLEFEMYTTKSNAWGMLTPTYFCLDRLGGSRLVDTLALRTFTDAACLPLADLFSPEPRGRMSYALLAQEGDAVSARIDDGRLCLSGAAGAQASFLIEMTQRGRRQCCWLPVAFTAPTALTPVADEVRIWPTMVSSELRVSVSSPACRIEVWAVDGRLVWAADASSFAVLNASAWPAGRYQVRVRTPQGVTVVPVLRR